MYVRKQEGSEDWLLGESRKTHALCWIKCQSLICTAEVVCHNSSLNILAFQSQSTPFSEAWALLTYWIQTWNLQKWEKKPAYTTSADLSSKSGIPKHTCPESSCLSGLSKFSRLVFYMKKQNSISNSYALLKIIPILPPPGEMKWSYSQRFLLEYTELSPPDPQGRTMLLAEEQWPASFPKPVASCRHP